MKGVLKASLESIEWVADRIMHGLKRRMYLRYAAASSMLPHGWELTGAVNVVN